MNLHCKNIKINVCLMLEIDFNLINLLNISISEKRTLFLLKNNYMNYVITIYKHNLKNLHITGIKTFHDMNHVVEFITNQLKNVITKITIDNTMFSCKLKKNIDINAIIPKIKNKFSNFSYTYNPEIFPALFIKPDKKTKEKGCPTVILFQNSSHIIIGGKSMEMVKLVNIMVKQII